MRCFGGCDPDDVDRELGRQLVDEYTPAPIEPRGRRAELTPARAIRSERVRWLEKGRIPLSP